MILSVPCPNKKLSVSIGMRDEVVDHILWRRSESHARRVVFDLTVDGREQSRDFGGRVTMALRIEDYALIGDCKTAALVGRDGSIDWLCWPRFDSAACFAALLGEAENGRWLIAPKDSQLSTSRRYRPGTLVLETEFRTETGSAAVIDFMPPADGADLVRIVAGQSGRVVFKTELVVRFNYGGAVPWVDRLDDGSINAIAGPERLLLRRRSRSTAKILERSASSRSRPASPFPLPSHMEPHFKVRRRRSIVSKRLRARRRSGANGATAVLTSALGRKRSNARSSR
jgi:Domain of unknown function (DUF5911)